MATKKRTQSQKWPRVVEGSHSRFTYYKDGSFDHDIYWDRLAKDIDDAIKSKTNNNKFTEAETVPNNSVGNKTSKKTGSGTRDNSTAKKKAANKKGKSRNDELA